VELDEGEPEAVALENARRKALAAAAAPQGPDETVLGVDTVVALHGAIHGKPAGAERARATLRALSGATHAVVGGLALARDGTVDVAMTATTLVTFRALDEETLDWYIASGEWRERAGAYAIQGAGAALVERIEGDYLNVVGLPLAALLEAWPELPLDGAG
jgi:septum formation protein